MRCKCDLNLGWTSLECPEHLPRCLVCGECPDRLTMSPTLNEDGECEDCEPEICYLGKES